MPILRGAAARLRVLAARDKVSFFRDEDLVFLMPVYRDAPVAAAGLRRLRTVYPASRVILLSDGDAEFPGRALAADFRAEYVLGDNLYGIEHGGLMIHRMLALYMVAPARWLMRLDTDARIDRRFMYLPKAFGVHGRVKKVSGNISGGCIVLTHDAASRLHQSRIFESERLKDPAASWGRYSRPDLFARKMKLGTVAYEKVLRWGCVETGVPLVNFPEIYSTWKPTPETALQRRNADLRYAVVHPDRMDAEQAGSKEVAA